MLSIIETFLQAPIGNTTLILTNYNVIQKSKNNQFRKNIRIGQKVKIVEKQNQGTDNYTFGVIKRILTSKKKHTRGIKVQLETGQVGRVQEILDNRRTKK